MFRRMLPLLVVVALGLVAFGVGLAALERIFAAERDSAREGLRARRDALAEYAAAALRDSLHARLEAALPRIEKARDDVLLPADGLFLVEGGEQLLPRTAVPLTGNGAPAHDIYDAIMQGESLTHPDDSPWAERVGLALAVETAAESGDRSTIESAFRALLAHRAGYMVRRDQDVPLMLAVLDHFLRRYPLDHRLLAGVLRDGFTDAHVGKVEGLESELLNARAELTTSDFTFLAGRIAALAGDAQVAHDDFSSRVKEPPGPQIDLGHADLPALVNGWYIESTDHNGARGVRVERGGVLVEVEKEMARRRLIAPGDHVVFASEVRASEPVDLVRVSVDSPEWARMERSTERLFAFKTGLIAVCGLLAAALVGLVLLDQGRKQRFLQLRSDFVATVSHELRTPLASLRVMTETLERRVSGTPGMRDYPARMIGEIDHLIFLVENILSFNRLDKGRWAPNVGDVALTDVLPSIHEEASNFSRVPVMVHAESLDGARVSADPEMLRLLFANLTRNACQYNARDCVDIRIDAARTDRLRVLFSDNGTGVSETDRERIFDEFYRGKSAPSGSRGSGLGLALCRRIMQLHRGTIRVADSGPEGTTFELTFL